MIPEDFVIGPKLSDLVDRVIASYKAEDKTQHIDRVYLPSRDQIVELVQNLLESKTVRRPTGNVLSAGRTMDGHP